MAEKRDPPAYQEYAAANLAKLPFRVMSLQDRGLLYTMRMECWVNQRLPADPVSLALVLGISVDEVEESLPSVMLFMKKSEGFIVCPELENYRQSLLDRRERQSQGGKTGAKITNKKRSATGKPTSKPQVSRRGSDESLVQSRPEQNSQNHSNHSEDSTEQWVEDYNSTDEDQSQQGEVF